MSIDVDKILKNIGTKGFGTPNSPASMIGQFGASLIPTTRKSGSVSTGGMMGASALQMAGMGAQFGPIGAGVGALVGAGLGLVKAGSMRREQDREFRSNLDIEKRNFAQSSRSILSSYPRSGVETGGFYGKNGGKIGMVGIGSDLDRSFMTGGNMIPLANGISIAKGRTHEQGGINLYDGKMNKFAEIEDEEVVKGTKVYSDTLKVPQFVLDALKKKR